jgi:hypothetical protein
MFFRKSKRKPEKNGKNQLLTIVMTIEKMFGCSRDASAPPEGIRRDTFHLTKGQVAFSPT